MNDKTVRRGRGRIQEEMANPTWTCSAAKAFSAMSADPPPAGLRTIGPRVCVIPPVRTKAKMLRVAGYCRVSTDMMSQETSIEGQRVHFRNAILAHPGWALADVYWESGVSGTQTETRPGLLRLLRDCEAGRVDMVVTKSISRFSRNTADLLAMVRSLSALGIPIRFDKENLQTDIMGSEFLLTVLGAFSQEESRVISSNMKWGIRKRFEAGTYRAAKAPYGYRKKPKPVQSGHTTPIEPIYIIEPAEAEVIRRIFYACVNGKKTDAIAKELNADGIPTWSGQNRPGAKAVWHGSTVRNILRNLFYTGDILYQKTFMDDAYRQVKNTGQLDQYLHEGSHEPIVDKDTFERAQAMIRCTQRTGRSRCAAKAAERS